MSGRDFEQGCTYVAELRDERERLSCEFVFIVIPESAKHLSGIQGF